MVMTGTEKAIFNLSVDMKKFNAWHGKFIKRGWTHYRDGLRKTALDLMGRIMGDWPVDTGRSRMGWSGLHKNMGKFVAPKGRPGRDVQSQISGVPISRAAARQEGAVLAGAQDRTKQDNPHFLIYNNVNYSPYIEAREQPVRRQVRRFYREFAKQVLKGAKKANDEAHR